MLLFHKVSRHCGRIAAEEYSTSFASAIRLLHRDMRDPVYSIYGFVRFADEIVDTFHDYDRGSLLTAFREETFAAIRQGLSLNPIVHGFQLTVRQFDIDESLIRAFFNSMETDLHCGEHDSGSYETYIYGSAEVVGLMCLRVFCEGNESLYQRLVPYARSLGAGFQKINFLRDLNADYRQLNRTYFPGMKFGIFTADMKRQIEDDIQNDFRKAASGIPLLPLKARFGVYVAYKYYLSLFEKIKRIQPARMLEERIRVPNYRKMMILLGAGLKNQLNLI
jgi:phytoene/squalene synthetase